MATIAANTECAISPPRNNQSSEPETMNHDVPIETIKMPMITSPHLRIRCSERSIRRRTTGSATTAPASREKARVSVPMYTRVGSPPSNISTIAVADAMKPTMVASEIARVRPNFHMAHTSTGHTT